MLRALCAMVLGTAQLVHGDALDDAVGQLAKKLMAHLAPDEVLQIAWAEPVAADDASLPYQNRAKALLARATQKRIRNTKTMATTATWSQNAKGYLMVVEIKRDSGSVVEMTNVPRVITTEAVSRTLLRIAKRLLWQQEARILDATVAGDDLLVLDTSSVTHYLRSSTGWKKEESASLDIPYVRDARGRLMVHENTVSIEAAGIACDGTWRPAIQVECRPGGRFTASRNTIEDEAWPAHFARAAWKDGTLVAESDGKTHIYDSARRATGTIDVWGSDIVEMHSCASSFILATGIGNGTSDTLALYEIQKQEAVRASDLVEISGPITALWPSENGGAIAIVRDAKTERYETYSLSVDCGR